MRLKWGIITWQGKRGCRGWKLLGADTQVQMSGCDRQAGRRDEKCFFKASASLSSSAL